MPLMWILIVLLLLAIGFGGLGGQGPYGWSPAGIILLVLLVLWATGNLR